MELYKIILDQGLFCLYKGQNLIGVIALITDDLIWAGKQIFTPTIDQEIFKIRSEDKSHLSTQE